MKKTDVVDETKAAYRAPGVGGGRDAFTDSLSRRLWPLEAAALRETACRRTSLSDFGDPPIEPALSALTRSLEQEAELHPLGRFLMRTHLRDLLETRLRLNAAWSAHRPALAAVSLRQPIIITGMPRSGSTFLHELLAEDDALRTPRVWEVMSPLSVTEPDRGWRDARVRKAATNLWWFRRLCPEADAIYPVRARTPHECVAIQSYTMYSEEFVSSGRVPGYEAMLRSADLRPVYQWERRFLQHLQWQRPEKRWLLKSPDHVYGLEALFSTFPDALVIQTHRDPLEVLRSVIHLAGVLHRLYARPGDRERLVKREAQVLAAATDRFTQFRDAHPQWTDRFMDVNYSELTADPLTVVRRIYRQFDMPLVSAAEERMRQLAANRSRYPGRQRVPTLADTGLDVSALKNRFDAYSRRFGVARS